VRSLDLGGRPLVSTEVRERLAGLVEPVVRGMLEQLDFAGFDAPVDADALLAGRVEVNGRRLHAGVFVQAHPSLLRVVVLGMPRYVEVDRIGGEHVPGLSETVDEILGAVLTLLGPESAEEAIAVAAAERRGGFVVSMDLVSGSVKVLLASEGQDLSRALALGGIADAPAVAH